MQEDLFMKYLHNLGSQLGSLFSEESAGMVQDAFFKNLKVKKTRDINVNEEISKRENKINDIRKEIEKQASTSNGMTLEQATAYAKKNGLSSIGYDIGGNISVQETEGKSPIFGNTQQTYPAYELQGAEFAPIIENFVKRATGRDSNIGELLRNATTNIRNIPLAMFYGENVPIGDTKDLLTYALYNKAKDYPVSIDIPGFKVSSTEKQGHIGIHYDDGSGKNPNLVQTPKVVTASDAEGRQRAIGSTTQNKAGNYAITGLRINQLHYRPYKKDDRGKLILDSQKKPIPENYFLIYSNDKKGDRFITKYYDDGTKEGGTKPYPNSSWSTSYNDAIDSINAGYGKMQSGTKSYDIDEKNNIKSTILENINYSDFKDLMSLQLSVNELKALGSNTIKVAGQESDVEIKANKDRQAFTSLDDSKKNLVNLLTRSKDGGTSLDVGYYTSLTGKQADELTETDKANLGSRIYDANLISLAELYKISPTRLNKFIEMSNRQGGNTTTKYYIEKASIIAEILSKTDMGK